MHYRAEIVIPPTPLDKIEGAIHDIMRPFSERDSENRHAFWDWFQIGGRYSNKKLVDSLDKEKLEAFYAWMREEKITVSGWRMGKETLEPRDQIGKVDTKWNEMFPTGKIIPCPLFDHCGRTGSYDVLPVSECRGVTCHTFIVGVPSYSEKDTWDGPLEAKTLLFTCIWNGVTHQDTAFDGTLDAGLAFHKESLENSRDEYKKVVTIGPDWLVVTVDYHN